MFTAGRIIRSTPSASRRNTIFATSPGAVEKKSSNVYRCYVPFVWQSLMTSIVGVTLMFGGITLCVVGFYATSGSDKSTSGSVNNDTKQALAVAATAAVGGSAGVVLASPPVSGMTIDGNEVRRLEAVVERGQDAHVTSSSGGGGGSGSSSSASMSYLGPVIMGVGCFAIIASVVVVCEVRERMIVLIERLGLRRGRREPSRDERSAETRRRWTCKSLSLPFRRQRCRPEVVDVGCRRVEKLPFKRDLVGFISLPLNAVAAGRTNLKNSSVCCGVAPSQNIAVVTNLPTIGEQSHSTDTVIVISEQRKITAREQIDETNGNGTITMATGLTLTRDDGTVEECLQHQLTPSQIQRDKDQAITRNCPAVSISLETEKYPQSTDLHPEPEVVTGLQSSSNSTQTVSIYDQLDDVSGGRDKRLRDVGSFSGHRQRVPSDDVIIELKSGSSTFRRRLSADSVLSTVHEALDNEDEDSSPESPNVDAKIDDAAVTFESKAEVGEEISCSSAAAAVDDETSSSDCKCKDIADKFNSDQVSVRHDSDITIMMITTTDEGNREQGSLTEGMEEVMEEKLPSSGAAVSFDAPEVVPMKGKAASHRRASEPFSCQHQSRVPGVTECNKPDNNPASLFSRQQTADIKPAEAFATTSNSPFVEPTKQQWSPKAARLWSSDAYYVKTGRRQATKMSLPPASHSAVAIVDVMGSMSSLKRSGRDPAPS